MYPNTFLYDIVNAPLDGLLHEASRLRREAFGHTIELCAIVNVKNGRCTMNCRFCAQSQHHAASIDTYPLRCGEKLTLKTLQYWDQNISRVGWVASGCASTAEELDCLIESAERLCRRPPPAACRAQSLCTSLGQLETEGLRKLHAAGFHRYHHNLETSERFYPFICTTQCWQDRRATVERAKGLGMSVCSGGLFGLGETWEDRLELAHTLQQLEVDSVPINFFSPIAGTPLADRKPLSVEEALRIAMLFRFILPQTSLRVCGGRPAVFGKSEEDHLLFRAGINALMTGNYLTTAGISPETDQTMIAQCGLET